MEKKDISFKDLPESLKPRERALKDGIEVLSEAEVLAIILQTGNKEDDVVELAKKIIVNFDGLDGLSEATIAELMLFNGIGKAKAIQVLAAIELGKRIALKTNNLKQIKNTDDIYNFALPLIGKSKQENLLAIYLDPKSKVIGKRIIAIGSLNTTAYDPRDIIKWALKYSATAVVVAHNHPSGEVIPSNDDIWSTEDIIMRCKAVGLYFVDHIIVGKNCYYSFTKQKCFQV